MYTIASYPTGEEEVEFYVVDNFGTLADIMKWRGERDLEGRELLEVREWTADEIFSSSDVCHLFIDKDAKEPQINPLKGFQVRRTICYGLDEYLQ